jgi:hypothetical protein
MIKEAADKHIPKRGRKKGPIWISQDTKGCGKEASDESGRKVSGGEEAEWRDTKKN